MAIDCWELAAVVDKASKDAVLEYLSMCGLDSPWEVSEAYMAASSAKALASHHLRVAIEFRLDRANNAPTRDDDLGETPVRLRAGNAFLDVAILRHVRHAEKPFDLMLDGIIEFKKQSSMRDDADLIEFMVKKKHVRYGLLVLFANGSSAEGVENEISRLTHELIESGKWKSAPTARPSEYPGLSNSRIKDRWWNICCLVSNVNAITTDQTQQKP